MAALIGGPLLAFNPLLSWESIGEWPLLNLLLLVYGLPALLLAALGYALETSADRRLAIALQGLGGAVGLLFVSLEIRQLFHGAVLMLGDIGLAELSCIIIAWLLIALGLFRLAGGARGAQFLAMARAVAGLAVVALVLGSLLYANPLLGVQDVGALAAPQLAGPGLCRAGPAGGDAESRSRRIRSGRGSRWRWRAWRSCSASPSSRWNCANGSRAAASTMAASADAENYAYSVGLDPLRRGAAGRGHPPGRPRRCAGRRSRHACWRWARCFCSTPPASPASTGWRRSSASASA